MQNPLQKNILSNASLWVLLLSNIIVIYIALTEGWNLTTLLWVYWFQSIVIGFFHFIRILQLQEFSTEGFKINGQPAQPTRRTKIFTAYFFLFHYGIFHIVYLIFLLTGTFTETYGESLNITESKAILYAALVFFINHLFSFFYNRPRDTKKQNIGALMFYPYARILPMHLTIILSSLFTSALLFFLVLKTFSDILMHVIEHKVIKKEEEQKYPATN
ncbi:hypothetical protein K2X96_01430 [Patescibacteria group bacterium]|nr:hypothetical protein [Patescibacteria group bacterium]